MKNINSYERFKQLTENNNCIVEFSSNDCPPCKVLKPILEELEDELSNITFAEVNINESKEISEKMTIFGVPTLLFISYGKEKKRIVGFINKRKLYKIIKGVFV